MRGGIDARSEAADDHDALLGQHARETITALEAGRSGQARADEVEAGEVFIGLLLEVRRAHALGGAQTQRELVAGEVLDICAVDLEVELEAVGPQTNLKGLHLARRRAHQGHRIGRQLLDFLAVALELHGRPRHTGQHGVGLARNVGGDLAEADFGLLGRADLATQGVGDELVAQADADQRQLLRVGLANELEFAGHPRGVVRDVHRAAQDDHARDVVKVRRHRLAAAGGIKVNPAHVQLVGMVTKHRRQAAEMVSIRVLQNNDCHRTLV